MECAIRLYKRVKSIENTIRLFHWLGANAVEIEDLTPELIAHFKQNGFSVYQHANSKEGDYVIDWSD